MWFTKARLLISAGVLLALAGVWFWHGHNQYQRGYKDATLEWQEVVRIAQMEAREERDAISEEVMRLSDPDIDKRLAASNWLRSDKDY